MGQGMERPVLEALVSDRLEERIEADFVRRMVNQAAPVICGVKPSSVFNYFPKACAGDADPDLVRRIAKDVIDTYSSLVSEYDVELVTVHASPERVALLAYRPSSLRKLLADDAVREFLQLQGYKTEDVASVVSCVCERMRRYYDAKRDRKRATCCERTGEPPLAAFPHEITGLCAFQAHQDAQAARAQLFRLRIAAAGIAAQK